MSKVKMQRGQIDYSDEKKIFLVKIDATYMQFKG